MQQGVEADFPRPSGARNQHTAMPPRRAARIPAGSFDLRGSPTIPCLRAASLTQENHRVKRSLMTDTRNSLTVTAVRRSLHGWPNPRMYGMLTADISGCVAFSLPVQRRNSQGLGIPAFFRSPLSPARCAAARWSGASPGGGTVLGYQHVSGTVLTAAQPVTRSLNPKGAVCNTPRRARSRHAWPTATD